MRRELMNKSWEVDIPRRNFTTIPAVEHCFGWAIWISGTSWILGGVLGAITSPYDSIPFKLMLLIFGGLFGGGILFAARILR